MADKEGQSYCCNLLDDDNELGQHQLPDLVDDLNSEHLHPTKPTESEENEISETLKSVFSNTNWSLKKEQIVCVRNLILMWLPTSNRLWKKHYLPDFACNPQMLWRCQTCCIDRNTTECDYDRTSQNVELMRNQGFHFGRSNLETEGEAEGRNESVLSDETLIKQEKIDVVFGSAENWMDPKWQKELREGGLGKVVSEIAVDKLHCVIKWYDPLVLSILFYCLPLGPRVCLNRFFRLHVGA